MHSTTHLYLQEQSNTIKLQVENISKSFILHNRDSVKVAGFSQVSFPLRKGELLALTGPSGAGKSSILKAIFRTYLTDCGTISFHRNNGSVVDLASCSLSEILTLRKREIGFVTQFLKVLPRISAIQAVAAPLIELGEEEKAALFQAGRMLDTLGIREELFHISPLTFSGGEQQRVNIARGVIAPKELILLDEPTASLDGKSSERVLDLLENLKKYGIAMIAIFHDKAKINRIADSTYEVCRPTLISDVEPHWEAA